MPKFRTNGREAFNFIWGIILLSFILGALVLNIKLDKRKYIDIKLENVGFFIIISGMFMLFGLMFEGYSFSQDTKQYIGILKNIGNGLLNIGAVLLFTCFVMMFFRIWQKLIHEKR